MVFSGCLGSSQYKEVTPSQLLSEKDVFEGKKICTNGIFENFSFSGLLFSENRNLTVSIKNGTLATLCGTYRGGLLEIDTLEPILSISTEKDVFQSNETLKVQIGFNSSEAGAGQIQVSGIRNAFGRALISETRDSKIEKGYQEFDFKFTTPSCEECSALSPGIYAINATVNINGKSFETYKNITLERAASNETQSNYSEINYTNAEKIKNETVISGGTGGNGSTVSVEYFYDPACQKCAKASPVIADVIRSYGSRVSFSKINILTDEGLALAKKYTLPGVPSVVINRERLIEYSDYDGNTTKLEELLRSAIDNAPTSVSPPPAEKKIVLSVPSVFLVGFLAGFNPCLLAILAFIASVTLATTGRRRNVLLIVVMFTLGIFTTYLVVGIGILKIFEQSPGLQNTIKNILVVVIGFLGVWHIYDAYHLKKNTESSFYTPKAFIRLTESVTKKVSLPASFFMGALFSLIKAPCVGAVYFLILDMVRSGDRSMGLLYLGAYNLGVVLPVLVLGVAIAFGLNPEKVEKFRKEKRSVMRLITGVTLLIIAVLMYQGWI